jgi:hypothetical protein
MKSSLAMSRRRQASENVGAIESAKACGVSPAASAARWIFSPYSSVPVRKYTSSPSRRCHRVRASPTIVV